MLLCTINTIPDRKFEALGLVQGSTVQSKHIGKDISAVFKSIVGGEIKGYTDMLEEARKQATEKMIKQAKDLGADAILGIYYTSSAVMQGASEILCYGTAVKFI